MHKLTAEQHFIQQLGIEVPIICGPMYPCSNPELVAAVSEAGGIGIIQPISLTYVHGYDFREGLRYIRRLTSRPIGFNALIERASKKYQHTMQSWIEVALEEGVRFFITSMGKPDWVVDAAHSAGAVVYHDVTERKWALKGLDGGVDGLIAVNNRAGGHAGLQSAQMLFDELANFNVPIICAGGISTHEDFHETKRIGYAGIQMGTRFIATSECKAPQLYKSAIVGASERDIVLTERVSGTPVSVINTPYMQKFGLKLDPISRWMFNAGRIKYLIRTIYLLKSLFQLKKTILDKNGKYEFWQAGKSVAGIHEIMSVSDIINSFSGKANE